MFTKLRKTVLFAVVTLTLLAAPVLALTFPQPEGYVNDFADVINQQDQQQLEKKLQQFEEDTTMEIAVVTVDSLQGTTIEEYAVRMFEDWKIGKEDEDNGILFLTALSERDVRIEVGYGLEARLNDAKAGRILDNSVLPHFKDDDYSEGIVEGTNSIISALTDEQYVPTGTGGAESDSGENFSPGDLFWIMPTILFTYVSSFLARSKSYWAGGVIGAILGIISGLIVSSLIAGIFATFGLGFAGLILDFLMSKNYKKRKKKGLKTGFFNSWGGFSSSSSGGGSFGGFGGGSSGGGGASGSW